MKKSVDISWVKKNAKKINVIDVRTSLEFGIVHLEGAINIPMNKLVITPEKYISMKKTYYIMCNHGGRALRTAEALRAQGYENVINVVGGAADL